MFAGYTINWRNLIGTLIAGLIMLGVVAAIVVCRPSEGRFRFGSGVTKQERDEIREGVRMMQEWLNTDGRSVKINQYVVYADDDLEALARWYAARDESSFTERGDRYSKRADIRPFFSAGGAVTSPPYILIYVGDAWRKASPADRKAVVAHEMFHIVQLGLVQGAQRFSSTRIDSLPDWLVEGSADWAAARALDHAGIAPYAGAIAAARETSKGTRAQLRSIEQPSPLHSAGDSAPYAIGFVAVDLLASISSETSVIAFWQQAGFLADWRKGFVQSFGTSTSAFYERFEALRDVEFPTDSGQVDGYVLKANGDPSWGAEFRACSAVRCYHAQTGKDGRVRLALPDGVYDIVVLVGSKDGPQLAKTDAGGSITIKGDTTVVKATAPP